MSSYGCEWQLLILGLYKKWWSVPHFFDLGLGIEAGTAHADKFFGDGFQMNFDLLISGRIKVPDINTTNPDKKPLTKISDMTISTDAGPGGGFHYGNVTTKSLYSW